jgi:hypothetical protein
LQLFLVFAKYYESSHGQEASDKEF